MWPYLITAKLMRPSNMKRFPTPDLDLLTHSEETEKLFITKKLLSVDI
jgi:hypothetical protein